MFTDDERIFLFKQVYGYSYLVRVYSIDTFIWTSIFTGVVDSYENTLAVASNFIAILKYGRVTRVGVINN